MKALIIGASGATGSALIRQLVADPDYRHISAFVRRPLDFSHPKLDAHIIDFDRPDTWAARIAGDVLYICLGSTRKQAGSRVAQWIIDHDYPLAFARAAAQNRVTTLALVSSDHAHPDSRLFYYRMKGTLEQSVSALPFTHCLIFRPPLLIRPHSDRVGEKFIEHSLRFFNRIGLCRSARPLPVATLAQAMRRAVKQGQSGIIDKTTIRRLATM